MIRLELIQIGDSVGVVLPEAVLAKLGVGNGDSVCLTEASNDGFRISGLGAEVAREITLGEEIMDEYGDTFRALAK